MLQAPSLLFDVSPGRQLCKGRGVCSPHHGTGISLGELQTPEIPKFIVHQASAAIAASNLLLPLLLAGSGMEPNVSSSLAPC